MVLLFLHSHRCEEEQKNSQSSRLLSGFLDSGGGELHTGYCGHVFPPATGRSGSDAISLKIPRLVARADVPQTLVSMTTGGGKVFMWEDTWFHVVLPQQLKPDETSEI